MVTIEITLLSPLVVLSTLYYILPVLHCLRGDALVSSFGLE